ncbi:MAG TPA: Asp-tRNA(Asn)/Glu-tRNA(Gln) amidotransferase subunit GatC [Candidatus Paceibacterota bacterium]|jgi:aspartyl-tRNA(Asn)/glutamyl-tRNA(Gln) amidotransferase subunit C|nr:Asp-tRNA(Asn)/Glu-tRNA(Gln) amidotransferase subunit GatC [Candidatus Paceibacterota bacterium]HPC12693.1 Asp-tRNA(Asn)/Glu-tRNA(Gln) amidotransferase subunit GatC [Candidatus Paceibacterota bacterium]HQC46180.1 Asp-tRNA(Asn)/Glu-tRNA(Gln) amidotransferase subunit GatC [Candidatus Paceibacterota bacterium]HQO70713.1 Asp-tRNA(Asn)/Glu-tRNA(Gln) amidotransferase subunit GatC [Candidatus Paceibacterota bacterium]HQQ22053.1 Asp-tRNA(Asn)/Glu-tRNA(Gln) amidotransferase subunit GatC [Candidatus Pa
MDITEIKKLANLSRIDIKDDEAKAMAQDFDAILAYVDQIKEVSEEIGNKDESITDKENYFLYNIMREDEVANNDKGKREDILKNAPDTQDGFIKVKQIL